MSNIVDSNGGGGFGVPVVLFFFKRTEKTIQVLDRIAQVRPKKLYLVSDGARNEEERELVEECRRKVDARIDWQCEVIRDYAANNRGVYDRIGLSAQRILSVEGSAIFLEDDNLPETSFFRFCEEMLARYKDDERVLWICGTNYMEKYEPADGSSYMFTHHMLPCGWASWGGKFGKYYDAEMRLLDDPMVLPAIKARSRNKALTRQHVRNWMREKRRIERRDRPNSWDYQMSLTLEAHHLLGIVPTHNQIRNIGVDEYSIHGGNDMGNVMTSRFCGMGSKPMVFPLRHPTGVSVNEDFEKKIGRIILLPFRYRLWGAINRTIRRVARIDDSKSVSSELLRIFGMSR